MSAEMGFSSKTSYVRKTPNGISFAFNSSGALICGILLNFQKTQVQVAMMLIVVHLLNHLSIRVTPKE